MKKILLIIFLISFSQDSYSEWDPNLESDSAIDSFRAEKDLEIYFKKAYAYVIFPRIIKVGFGIGGAGGLGEIYEDNKLIGCSKLSQAKIGFIWGGNSYSQIIFLQNKEVLEKFMEGKFEFGADASGQFFTKGGGVIASFKDGMAISTLTIRGLGYDASLAGQAFNSKKLNKNGKCSK